MRVVCLGVAALLSGCVIQVPAQTAAPPPPDTQAYSPPVDSPQEAPPAEEAAPDPAVSVYVEPPLSEPAPIAVGWAPPPMLVEAPPPAPFPAAVWVGGYWVWQGNWVWAHGHWVAPPGGDYMWVHPYYEHRGDEVIFIDGHWSRRGVVFVPPPPGLHLVVERPAYGVVRGPRPMGPDGCFVPAPPGSRAGIIIPAPVGTAPAVVTSAPAVVNVGMRITNNVTNVSNVHVTNVTNVTNVTIVAPPAATASGRAFNTAVPAAPHLAASRPALVQARAPEPVSAHPLPAYVPGSRPPTLPHPQPVVNPGGHMPPAFNRETEPPPVQAGNHPQGPSGREPQPVRTGPGSAEPTANMPHAQTPYVPAPQLARDTPPGHEPANVRGGPPGHAPQPASGAPPGHDVANVRQVPPGHAPQVGQAPPPPRDSAPALASPPPAPASAVRAPASAAPALASPAPAVAHPGSAAVAMPPHGQPASNKPAQAHGDGDKPHKSEGQPQHDKQKDQGTHQP